MGDPLQAPAIVSQGRDEGARAPYVVCAMFSAAYRAKADALAASLTRLGLPFALFEVPNVHRSISTRGVMDMAHCKPRFIATALAKFHRPVLYVDADFVFCRQPTLISTFAGAGVDFAIYNWLADLMNDAWGPDPQRDALMPDGTPRYWQFGFGVEKVSQNQMLCSGGVQYWAATSAARGLLSAWERQIEARPRSPDDELLDYVFNFSPAERRAAKTAWLPKEYVRYIHWPYVEPVTNHPDVPARRVAGNFDYLGDARVNAAELTDISKARPFPRGAILDVLERRLLFSGPSGAAFSMPLTIPLFL